MAQISLLIKQDEIPKAAKAAHELAAALDSSAIQELIQAKAGPTVEQSIAANRVVARGEELTAQHARSLLEYDPETGHFKWSKKTARRTSQGAQAGTVSKEGYVSIMIMYRAYKAHRLAWLYVHGTWPTAPIDHINGDPGDNRIANLRLATPLLNTQNNRRARVNNQSGFLGVAQVKGGWRSQISVGRQRIELGTYATPEQAHAAYVEAKRRLHAGGTI